MVKVTCGSTWCGALNPPATRFCLQCNARTVKPAQEQAEEAEGKARVPGSAKGRGMSVCEKTGDWDIEADKDREKKEEGVGGGDGRGREVE